MLYRLSYSHRSNRGAENSRYPGAEATPPAVSLRKSLKTRHF